MVGAENWRMAKASRTEMLPSEVGFRSESTPGGQCPNWGDTQCPNWGDTLAMQSRENQAGEKDQEAAATGLHLIPSTHLSSCGVTPISLVFQAMFKAWKQRHPPIPPQVSLIKGSLLIFPFIAPTYPRISSPDVSQVCCLPSLPPPLVPPKRSTTFA